MHDSVRYVGVGCVYTFESLTLRTRVWVVTCEFVLIWRCWASRQSMHTIHDCLDWLFGLKVQRLTARHVSPCDLRWTTINLLNYQFDGTVGAVDEEWAAVLRVAGFNTFRSYKYLFPVRNDLQVVVSGLVECVSIKIMNYKRTQRHMRNS